MTIDKKPKGISPGVLSIGLIVMAIVVMLALIKIHIANKIYYESMDINKLIKEVSALKEERSILKTNVEQLKYKTQVTDTIFDIDDGDD